MKLDRLIGVMAVLCFLPALHCKAANYEINTFLNVGAATHNSHGEYLQGIPDKIAYEYDTSYGINLRTQLSDNVEGVAQLIASGRSGNFEVDFEWGFVEYYLSDAWRLRIGKMNLQTFLLSDYIEVGYLYPWVRPPEEVYGFNPMRNYPGLEIMHTAKWGKETEFTSMLFTGSAEVKISDVTTMRAVNGIGMNFQLSTPGFRIRAGAISPLVEIDQKPHLMPGGLATMPGAHLDAENRMLMTTFGLSWDLSNFIGYGEWIKVTSQDELHQFFPDETGYYLTLGYKFGNLMPYITYASADADPFTGTLTQGDNGRVMPNPAIAQASISLGMRYEMNEYSSFKLEAKRIDPKLYSIQTVMMDLNNDGNIDINDQMAITPNAGFLISDGISAEDETYMLFSISYNMIF